MRKKKSPAITIEDDGSSPEITQIAMEVIGGEVWDTSPPKDAEEAQIDTEAAHDASDLLRGAGQLKGLRIERESIVNWLRMTAAELAQLTPWDKDQVEGVRLYGIAQAIEDKAHKRHGLGGETEV